MNVKDFINRSEGITIWEDPIVKELHAMRAAHAELFKYDIDAMFRELQEKERQSGVRYVSYSNPNLTHFTSESN